MYIFVHAYLFDTAYIVIIFHVPLYISSTRILEFTTIDFSRSTINNGCGYE